MEDAKYFIENEKLIRFTIVQDTYPNSPREWDNLGHMICNYSGYTIGDEQSEDMEEYIDELVQKNIKNSTIINYIRKGKASNNLEIKYNRKDKVYELIGDYYVWWNGKEIHRGELTNQPTLDYLVDDIIEALPIRDKISMLERKGFIFIPLNIYEHSGLTMYTGSIHNHYDSQWDCSSVGFIYTTREEALKWGYNKRNWRKETKEELEAEVDIYDMYLKGEVYGYIKEYYDDDDFYEEDSCWGYYSKKWGDELIYEIASGIGIETIFISEEEKEKYISELKKKKEIKEKNKQNVKKAIELVNLRKQKRYRK